MNKNMMKVYALSALNGAGYACAASTALVWAFPKLAKRNLDPVHRIACGLAGFAWAIAAAYRVEKQLEAKAIGEALDDVTSDAPHYKIWLEDEA